MVSAPTKADSGPDATASTGWVETDIIRIACEATGAGIIAHAGRLAFAVDEELVIGTACLRTFSVRVDGDLSAVCFTGVGIGHAVTAAYGRQVAITSLGDVHTSSGSVRPTTVCVDGKITKLAIGAGRESPTSACWAHGCTATDSIGALSPVETLVCEAAILNSRHRSIGTARGRPAATKGLTV